MSGFPLALGAFVLLHIGVSASGLRGLLVARMGEGAYRGLFAAASAVALAALIWTSIRMAGDATDPLHQLLYTPPAWGRHAAHALVLIGFLFAGIGLFTPGPTLAGGEKLIEREEPARGVLRITRHPFLWGVALWGTGHLLANGERASVMLFGSLTLMVLLGTRSIDRKGAARNAESWKRFAGVTSNIPFAAIVQGRNKIALGEIGWRGLAALALFAFAAWAHGVIGPQVFP